MSRISTPSRRTIVGYVAATAAALVVLSGCASAQEPEARSTPLSGSWATGDPTEAPFVSDATTDACVDGFAWMTFHDDDPSEKSLPGGCDTVVVAGVDGTLHSGPARVVVVMGARNHVEVETVTQVDVEGVDNEVVHGSDSDPVVNTDGTGNTVTAR